MKYLQSILDSAEVEANISQSTWGVCVCVSYEIGKRYGLTFENIHCSGAKGPFFTYSG